MNKRKNFMRGMAAFIATILIISVITVNIKWENAKAESKYEISVNMLKPYVEALKAAHPNWTFEYYDTGLSWSEVLANEMLLSRSLVSYASEFKTSGSGYTVTRFSSWSVRGVDSGWYQTPTSWMSTDVKGSYNWDNNNWVLLSGGWVQASEAAVKYMLDPRNWITENNIFSFEKLSYSVSGLSEADANAKKTVIMNALINMMKNTFMDTSYAIVDGSSGSYATVLYELGEKYNVSPIYLCTKLLYEKGGQGIKDSNTGCYTMNDTLGLGVSSSDGKNYHKAVAGETAYYNMFNIQASGTTPADIINNGAAEAKENGWTSQYSALEGGIKKIAEKYIAFGQTTLYFQKWAVSVPAKYRYWKQYQQAITAAVNEGYNNRDAYQSKNLIDSPFTFVIPVYYDMPAEVCGKPTPDRSTANPNYKLKNISLSGTDVWGGTTALSLTPSFNKDTTSYSVVVPYTISKITISANAIASTSAVSGTGTFDLNVGDNNFAIVCKSEYGTSCTYNVKVTRSAGNTLLSEIKDESGKINMGFSSKVTEYNKVVTGEVESISFAVKSESGLAKINLVDANVIYTSEAAPDGMTNMETSDTGVKYGALTQALTANEGYYKTPNIYLKKGDNTIVFDVYPSAEDTSAKTRYVVKIYRTGDISYDMKEIKVNGEYVGNFAIGDKVGTAKAKMSITGGIYLITDKDGNVKNDDSLIATGDILRVQDDANHIIKTFRIIIYGDVNGDGKVDLYDFVKIKNKIIRNVEIEGIYNLAGNASEKSEGIDLYDFVSVKNFILRNIAINQNR